MSKFVVTCFKRSHDRSGDSFVNSYGQSKSEWELLKEDATLKSLQCGFELIEYQDIRSLVNGYDKKVDTFLYIDVRREGDFASSIPYRAQLLATHIAGFVIEFAKKHNTQMEVVVREDVPTVTTEAPKDVVTTEASPVIITEPSFVNSWKLPVTIVSGVLFLAMIAGAVVFFDWRRRKGSRLANLTPLFLSEVPEKPTPVNFAQIKFSASKKAIEEQAEL